MSVTSAVRKAYAEVERTSEQNEFQGRTTGPAGAFVARSRARTHAPLPMDEDALSRSLDALDAIRDMGKRCTCTATSDIRDCPNYVEGDEEVDA